MRSNSTLLVLLLSISSIPAYSVTYDCKVTKKTNGEIDYAKGDLEKRKFSILLEETAKHATVSRCSFSSSENKVTCDKYAVDKIQEDKIVGIKKYYVFNAQFDFQLFSSLSGLENNGRGDISFSKCQVISP